MEGTQVEGAATTARAVGEELDDLCPADRGLLAVPMAQDRFGGDRFVGTVPAQRTQPR
ncbi:hypothetical protein [Nonomuraea phyllanthi]|uniref:hypothetical protein n=1 Tax=Nonomuraea phyllanthi TaxID=2219224 RepID=UPI00129340BC|nr:hypothetical protein [Nonomuraea phyllanthi]